MKSAFRLGGARVLIIHGAAEGQNFAVGRITAFISMRAWLMLGPYCHVGVAAPISMISVVLVAGFPPPIMITLGS